MAIGLKPNQDFFIKDEETNHIYELYDVFLPSSESFVIGFKFSFFAGKDYVTPDINDHEGYLNSDYFVDIDNIYVSTYKDDSLQSVLQDDGYTILTSNEIKQIKEEVQTNTYIRKKHEKQFELNF